jgi:hypothetical protein
MLVHHELTKSTLGSVVTATVKTAIAVAVAVGRFHLYGQQKETKRDTKRDTHQRCSKRQYALCVCSTFVAHIRIVLTSRRIRAQKYYTDLRVLFHLFVDAVRAPGGYGSSAESDKTAVSIC